MWADEGLKEPERERARVSQESQSESERARLSQREQITVVH